MHQKHGHSSLMTIAIVALVKRFGWLGALILGACSYPQQPQVIIWSQQDQQPIPSAILEDPSFKIIDRQLVVNDKNIEFSEQRLGQAFVTHGHLYKVFDKRNKDIVFIRAQSMLGWEDVSSQNYGLNKEDREITQAKAQELYVKRGEFYQKIQRKYAQFHQIKMVDQLRVMYDPTATKDRFYYQLRYIPKTQDRVEECDLLLSLEIKECRKISMDFQAPAWVLTLQNLDELKEVILSRIVSLGGHQIFGQNIKVRSQGGPQLTVHDIPLKFAFEDPRFDQAQSYYWVEKGLDFIEKYGIRIPASIDIETFIGFPDYTNAAFTFQNQIRLGRGDGKVYQYLAQDPSIILHELGHVLAYYLAFLPTQGQGGSINEGVADYFAATITGSPLMGAKSFRLGLFRRNIDQFVTLNHLSNKLYQDSLIVSSLMWHIEKVLGSEKTQKLLFDTLIHLGPAHQISEWGWALQRTMKQTLNLKDQATVRLILEQRNWPLINQTQEVKNDSY